MDANWKSGIAAMALAMGLAGAAHAQEATVPAQAAATDEPAAIVVTAQRRDTKVQDSPLSISVVGGVALQQKGITNLDQIGNLVPGVKIDNNGGRGYIYIRGIGTDSVGIGVSPSVASYIDGVYYSRGNTIMGGLWDIDHVEVLKGPQGSLYGRNATGGAVLLVTKQPKLGEVSGYAFGSYGNLDRKRAEAAINLPIGDKVALRVSGLYLQDDGYMHNLYKDETVGGQKTRGVRATMLIQPNDVISATLSGFYERTTGSRGATFKLDASQPSPTLTAFPGVTIPTGKYDVNYDGPNAAQLTVYGGSLTLRAAKGPVEVKSISAYSRTIANRVLDFDATEIPFNQTIEGRETSKSVSESLQASNVDQGRFNWVVGAEWFHDELYADIRQAIYPTTRRQLLATNNDDAISAFVDANYEIVHGLRLIVGGRYSVEDAKFFFRSNERGNWNNFTPKAGLQYDVNRNVMLYATAAKGFKSGGFNSSAVQPPFGPEKIWSYEGGIKSTWWNDRVTANASFFHYDYSNLQVTQIDGTTGIPVTANAGKAKVNGVDGELDLHINRAFQIGGSFTWLDTKFGNLSLQNVALPGSPFVSVRGNQFSRAPKFSAEVNASYSYDLGEHDKLTLSGDARYSTRIYFTPFDSNVVSQPGYAVADARLAWTHDRYELAVYVNNLTDKFYIITKQTYPTNIGTSYLPAEPRTYGVSGRVNF